MPDWVMAAPPRERVCDPMWTLALEIEVAVAPGAARKMVDVRPAAMTSTPLPEGNAEKVVPLAVTAGPPALAVCEPMAKAVTAGGDCPLPLAADTSALVVVPRFPFALGDRELVAAGAAAKADDDGFDGCCPCGMIIAEMVIGTGAVAAETAPASDEVVDGRFSDCGLKVNSGTRWDGVDVGVGACTV